MTQIPGTDSYVLVYLSDRIHYEFHNSITKFQSNTSTTIEFRSTCYELKQPNSVLGDFNSVYKIEAIEETTQSTNDSEEKFFSDSSEHKNSRKVSVTWNSHFCKASYPLVRGDLFQEDETLKKSIERFIYLAENTKETPAFEKNENPLIDACNRKYLKSYKRNKL